MERPTGDYMESESGWSEYLEAQAMAQIEADDKALRERVLAAAVKLAVKQDRTDLALALLDSEIAAIRREAVTSEADVVVDFIASTDAFNVLQQENAPQGAYDDGFPSRLYYFLSDILPPDMNLYNVTVRPRLEPVPEDWRETFRATLDGAPASNQGREIGSTPLVTHNGLNYRSKAEVAVAKALDEQGVLFLPNCRASRSRVTKEADFLVFHKGRVGILEVDGPTHTGRAAADHQRDWYFKERGIRVEHFDASLCWSEAPKVVDKFLELLMAPAR